VKLSDTLICFLRHLTSVNCLIQRQHSTGIRRLVVWIW